MNHKALGVLLVGTFGCGGAQTARQQPPDRSGPPPVVAPIARTPEIVVFGAPDKTGLIQTQSSFQHIDGALYGWRMKLPCTAPVEYIETLTLPDVGDWTFDPKATPQITLSADNKTATTHDIAVCRDGWVESLWNITANDPFGIYVMTVEIVVPRGFAKQTFTATFN